MRDSANEHDEFWNQHNFDVEHYIDKTQEEEAALRQKVEQARMGKGRNVTPASLEFDQKTVSPDKLRQGNNNRVKRI